MEKKSQFITPFVMLLAGAVSLIIMMIRGVEFYRMLWTLFIVLIVFFVIGDIARYLYSTISPRVIPASIDLNTIAQIAERRMQEEPDTVYLDDFDSDSSSKSQNSTMQNEEPQMYLDENFDEYIENDFEQERESEIN